MTNKTKTTTNAREANEALTIALSHLKLAMESGTPLTAEERSQCGEIVNAAGKVMAIAREETKRMELAGVKPDLSVGFFAVGCAE